METIYPYGILNLKIKIGYVIQGLKFAIIYYDTFSPS